MIYMNESKSPRLHVPRADKTEILAAMSDVEPIGIAAGYITDYATGELTDIVGALYEKDGVSWSREKAWNFEHNDMEVSDEFADALLGRGKR
ncbi:MAG: hypothetical protein PUG08_03390 [Parafannyhessea umbonata]|uniref:Uncharacterized protein n=1 Tax=Olsenella absiana TaxID=3115222 RepID=A0ABU7RBF5_9ACTN|nr:hypothetical protein [Parafannyhessea umbonata]MDD6358988.1 hypothetical protein [Parafannyhessea umbonata]MDD6600886.1 hypothetical protein [Parafannyhessea umbonata]